MDQIVKLFESPAIQNILIILGALFAGWRMVASMQQKINSLNDKYTELSEKHGDLKAQTDSLMAWRLQMAESIGRIEAKLDMVIRAFDKG